MSVKEESYNARRFWWFFVTMSRGLAAFLALYSALSLAAVLVGGVYNQNTWWIDTGFLPQVLSILVQVLLTLALGLFAVRVPKHIPMRVILAIPIFSGLFVAVVNTVEVYSIASMGTITLGFPLPFSFFVSIGFLCILLSVLVGSIYLPTERKPRNSSTALLVIFSAVFTILIFPVGQIYCFGTTDYRVKVDAAVVFGAQVYPDGTPSPTLQDRLDTAIKFYKEGFTPQLVMSGGTDVEGVNEAEAMRDYAIMQGVPSSSIIIDQYGENTQLTARNTVQTLQASGFTTVATVSNFYHLARIKMLYLAEGMDVVTVPSQTVKGPYFPLFNIVREIPGWWYYWVHILVE